MYPHIFPALPVKRRSIIVPAHAPAFYRLRDVLNITALSRSTIYRRIAEGRFPAPVHLGGRASGWPRAALQQWVDNPEQYRTTEAPN
jgi:prophage regulatory protein